jgi:hypothetical protein
MKIKITESQLKRLIENHIEVDHLNEEWYDDAIDFVKSSYDTVTTKAKDVFKDLTGIDFGDKDDVSKDEIPTSKEIKKNIDDFKKEMEIDKEEDDYKPSDKSEETSDFMKITKRVIDKFEGGYWNPKCGHPTAGMGKSTETMFGLDRYNGNIESTPDGREFFKIIDRQKSKMGMSSFCKKWKWGYRGGENEDELKNLAASVMKNYFDKNMSTFVKDSKTKDKILNIPSITLHMSYATWNGPRFFQNFARSLEKGVKSGKSDKELINIAINDRKNLGIGRQGPVVDEMKKLI